MTYFKPRRLPLLTKTYLKIDWINKVAVIIDATSGIGNATKELLRSKGAFVYDFDQQKPEVDDPFFISCNVAKKEEINAAVDKVLDKEKKIDFLFTNAGSIYSPNPVVPGHYDPVRGELTIFVKTIVCGSEFLTCY